MVSDSSSDDEFVMPPMLQAPDDWLAGADLPPKTLALTFDDGPGDNTMRIARFLEQEDVPATFFVVGARATGREWMLDELTRLGHTVGNHSHFINSATHNHWLLGAPGGPDPVENVAACDQVIAPRVLDDVYLFRAPFFYYTSDLEKRLLADPRTSFHLGSIRARIGNGANADDSVDAGYMADWQCWNGPGATVATTAHHPFTPEQCAAIYLREISQVGNSYGCSSQGCDHGVVLMHEHDANWELAHGKENDRTAIMVELLVPQLKKLGYRFASLEDVPSIASAISGVGNPNLKPATWDALPRRHSVHWHRLRVAESSPSAPGTLSHSFERDAADGTLSWDDVELGGCATEIAATTTTTNTVVIAALGCDRKVRVESFVGGDSPRRLRELANVSATALLELEPSAPDEVTLKCESPSGVQTKTWRPAPRGASSR